MAPEALLGPTTYHLVPEDVWRGADPDLPYAATSLADEGFIHCTNGVAEMVATANRHYRSDPRRFLVLTIDLDRVGSAWRYDEPASPYPHVYGSIDRAAIVAVAPIRRDGAGRFLRFERVGD